MDDSKWMSFRHSLPRDEYAVGGMILTRMKDGSTREAMWNWIPPHHADAALLWETNGFVAWQPLRLRAPA